MCPCYPLRSPLRVPASPKLAVERLRGLVRRGFAEDRAVGARRECSPRSAEVASHQPLDRCVCAVFLFVLFRAIFIIYSEAVLRYFSLYYALLLLFYIIFRNITW